MVKRRAIRHYAGTLLVIVAGLVLAVSMAAPASAGTASAATSVPGAASRVCTVTATAFEHRGTTNIVTATRTTCGSISVAPDSAQSNVHVGYGCNGSSFTSTCWWFDVPSPGCSGGASWGWSSIYQNNVLSSWEAVDSCSHGRLWDLPYYGGTNITCYTCYSLGSMDNKTTSMKVYQ